MPVVYDGLIVMFRNVGFEISRLLSEYGRVEVRGGEWVPVEGSSRGVYVGVDSSRQSELYRFFFVYAVQGVSIVYDSVEGMLLKVSGADVDFVELAGSGRLGFSSRFRDAIISSTSRNLEVFLVQEAVSKFRDISLVLMDGSYASFTVPVLIPPQVSGKFKGLSRVVDKLREGWSRRVKIMNSISREFKVAFISKSISKTYIASEENPRIEVTIDNRRIAIPDFMVASFIALREGARKPGFLWYENPYFEIKSGTIEMARKEGANIEKWYTLTYVLLHPTGRLYQLTTPGKLSKREVEQIVEALLRVSPEGYPQPLSIPHHTSRLTRKDFKSLITLAVPQAETGREPLEQTI